MVRDLIHCLETTAARLPGRGIAFPKLGQRVTYLELHDRAAVVAANLIRAGVTEGAVVSLIMTNGPEFIIGFFAILRAGGVPATLPLPQSAAYAAAHGAMLCGIIDRAQSRFILTNAQARAVLTDAITGSAAWRVLLWNDLQSADCALRTLPGFLPNRLALIQFTSGSTSLPKGVALTHANILASLAAIVSGARMTDQDINNQWLPLYHDMGLIGMLASLSVGCEQYVWSPQDFVRNAATWLSQFAATQATLYAGPHFSFNLMRKSVPPAALDSYDLSSWRVAFNGSEPIVPDEIDAFTRHFQKAGFRSQTMFPVYGLAEATLAAAFPAVEAGMSSVAVDRLSLEAGRAVTFVPEGGSAHHGVRLACLGQAVKDHEIVIKDCEGHDLEDLVVGEICLAGPALTRGYHLDAPATAAAFFGRWLRTGDLGFLADGRLYVTGRLKELIIVNGRKFYPHDAEAALRSDPMLQQYRCAAIASKTPGSEHLIIVIEIRGGRALSPEATSALTLRAKHLVQARLGLAAVEVALVKPKTVRVTTSGKIRRGELADLLALTDFKQALVTPTYKGDPCTVSKLSNATSGQPGL